MPNYLLSYHGGAAPEGEEAELAVMEAWNTWLDAVSENVLDPGNPTGESRTIAADGSVSPTAATGVSGYAIIEANDMDEAIEIARGCPVIANGGSIEVSELLDMIEFVDEFDDEEDED